jgi:hypothetical protein
MKMKKRRSHLRMYRDIAFTIMWILIVAAFLSVYFTYAPMLDDATDDILSTGTARAATVMVTPRDAE